MNHELSKIVEWLNVNKLSVNIKKTHYMIFSRHKFKSNDLDILYINNQELDLVDFTTFLGIVIDSKLSWANHINKIRIKIAKNIGVICKARKVLKEKTLTTLYYTFIYPYIVYCIEVWGMAANVHINSIVKLQKRICRIISGSPPRTPSAPLFVSLNILTVRKVYQYSVSTFMFKLDRFQLPTVVSNLFMRNCELHSIGTRQSKKLHVSYGRLQVTTNTIKFKGVELWNHISSALDINTCTSLNVFKKSVKKYLLHQDGD
jgi:hypothetical protein